MGLRSSARQQGAPLKKRIVTFLFCFFNPKQEQELLRLKRDWQQDASKLTVGKILTGLFFSS